MIPSPLQQPQYYQRSNSFRPIVDAYCNSLTTRPDIRSPQNCRPRWPATAMAYLDDDDEAADRASWMRDGGYDVVMSGSGRRCAAVQQPPPSYSPPQPVCRRTTPISSAPAVPPILRPDNYTLKRPRPAATDYDDRLQGDPDDVDDGHMPIYLGGESGTTAAAIGGDTTDSGYSLQRSSAPPSPAPLDNV